jgi:surface polysaccharide O-acyltransferase-like enzyme
MQTKEKILSIEYLRIFALFAVVLIHFNAQGFFQNLPDLGFYLDALGRFAVPVFFFLSGYFVKQNHISHPNSYFAPSAKRLLLPYGFWFLIYNWYYLSHQVQYDSLKSISKLIYHFFIKGGAGYHLWFLPALFIGSNLALQLRRRRISSAIFLSLVLYFFGIFISYFTDFPNWVSRSGIFFTPIFFVLGISIQKEEKWKMLLENYSWPILFGGAILHLFESIYFAKNTQFGLNLSIGLIFFSSGMFGIVSRYQNFGGRFSNIGKYVFGAYLLHVAIIYGLKWQFESLNLFQIFAAIFFTAASSLIICMIFSKIPIFRKFVL